jgi:hypothetical protein
MLSDACKKGGLEMGVYISPWDRNHPDYGTPKYNDIYIATMKELLTGYGKFFELWWDGANGEGPNGKKQEYTFRRFEDSAFAYQPHLMIFSDIGPSIRWCGNERGIIGNTNWNLLDTAGFYRGHGGPPEDTLNQGNVNGKLWIPAEADVSIRPGWFYHAKEDNKVKSPNALFNLFLKFYDWTLLVKNVDDYFNEPISREQIFYYMNGDIFQGRTVLSHNLNKKFFGMPGENLTPDPEINFKQYEYVVKEANVVDEPVGLGFIKKSLKIEEKVGNLLPSGLNKNLSLDFKLGEATESIKFQNGDLINNKGDSVANYPKFNLEAENKLKWKVGTQVKPGKDIFMGSMVEGYFGYGYNPPLPNV